MTELFTLGLIVGLVLLIRRVNRLETRLAELERNQDAQTREPVAPRTERPKAAVILRTPPPHEDAPVAAPPEPASSPEPSPYREAEPEPVVPARRRSIGFEELFGSRLPIWGGGITLAVAGLFIVKYSIDSGLLSPAVRVVLGLIFAMALAAGAEVARRWKATAIDPRVAQALSGAGVAAAYADILMATNVYHLVPQWMGFAGLALVTASALGLALRFGAPSALLGLVGGLAAPVLVGEQSSSVAPLTLYLALVVAGLSAVARRQRWPWLSAAALAGGFGWSILLIGLQRMDSGNSAALGVYALLLAFALPLLATGFGHERLLRAAAAVIGTVQLALIVSMGSYSLFNWGLYGLLSLAAIMLARFDSRLSWLPLVALGIGLLTMLGWSNPPLWHLALVSGMAMLMFAVPPLLRPARWPEALQQALAWAGPVLIARMIVPESVLSDDRWGWIALAVLLPLAGSALRTVGQARAFAILTVAATLMLGAGLAALLPMRLLALAFAIVLAALTELRCRHAGEYRPALALAAVLVAMALSAPTAQWLLDTLLTLDGRPFYFGRAMLPSDVLLILLLPPVLIGYALWRYRAPFARVAIGLPGMLLLIGLFYLYKQLFRIEGASDFLLRGMAERVLLTQLFCAAAWLAWRRGLNVVAAALATIALLRVGLYDMFIFNPIWRDQLVDQLPLANLLAPAYLFPAAWLWLARPAIPERWVGPALPAMDVGQMLLILFFAAASIRQLFHGSLIAVGGVSEGENFAYSAAAILIALGFLRWGIFRRDRLWRIASLVLMLFAVGKVFLSDAAGLDGLLRIASFVGLGLSLIGIGWLYSRHVRPDDQPAR